MTQKWKGAATTLAVTAMLLGTSSQGYTAAPEVMMKNAEALTKNEVKLPARAEKIVAALETLEPDLKALTRRSVRAMEGESNQVVLSMEKLYDRDINASMDFDGTTGELLYFETSTAYMNQKEREVVSDEIFLQRAEKVVQELLGADREKRIGAPQLVKFEDAKTSGESVGVHAIISYSPVLNGLEVNGVRAGMTLYMGNSGNLIGADYRPLELNGAKVPDPKTALEQDAIKKKMFTPDRFYFGYVLIGSDRKPSLSYVLRSSPVFNATTGKQVEAEYGREQENGKSNPANVTNITLKPQAKPFIVKSEADAKNVVKRLFGINTEQESFSLRQEEREDVILYFGGDGSGTRQFEILVDKPTGEIISADRLPMDGTPDPMTKEQALQKAISSIQPFVQVSEWQVEMIEHDKEAPLAEWMLGANGEDPRGDVEDSAEVLYSFDFTELHKGVPVLDHYILVTIDAATGQVVTMEKPLRINHLTLPVSTPTVTEQQAADLLAKNVPLKLSYFWPTFYGKKPPSLYLIYTIDSSKGWPLVDAVNGSVVWNKYDK